MPAPSSTSHRNEYSNKEDLYLEQYIAKYNPQPEGRTGNKLYERLVEDADGKWPWHKRHTWQSWRERYRSNQNYFDRRIAKRLRAAAAEGKAKSGGSAASASPIPAPPARAQVPQSSPSGKRERVPYTMEDDDNLAEYLAANSVSNRGRQGKNLYEAIADEPWGARHTWQSWHERYRRNHAYFDARIRRIHAGEDDGEDGDGDGDVPRPRTVDGTVKYSLSQSRAHAQREKEKEREREQAKEREREKRRRESAGDAGGEAPPRKKTRVEQPVAGPPRRESEVVEVPEEPEVTEVHVHEEPEVEMLDQPDVGGAPEEPGDEGPPDGGEEQAVVQDEEQVAVEGEGLREEAEVDGDGRGEEQDVEDQDELEVGEDEDDEDEEEQGPIGSDDYRGEIFDEPEEDAEAEGEDGSESESDRDQEEAELMLSDNPFADVQDMEEAFADTADVDADVEMGGDETVVEAGGAQLQVQDEDHEENPFNGILHDVPMASSPADNDGTEPHLSTTPPSGASPPARTHNTRIEHDIDARPDTPELSPAESADARRRREHGHEPAPARKHPMRIRALRRRGRGEDDFFGTPTPTTSALNSPTARHVARRDGEGEGDKGSPEKRQREPPRLDEGAWNTAFSDARGRARASPKRPRRSGVEPDFDFEDAEAGEPGEEEGAGAGAGEEVDKPPAQWPPMRGRAKDKGKGKVKAQLKEEAAAPMTPARGARDKGKAREVAASPGEGRVVTTEHILSVKTIRTVERRPAHGVGGAGVEAAREAAAAAEQPSSPRTLVQEDADANEDEGGDRREEVKVERHPFNQVEPRGLSVFPRAGGGARDSRKEDIARMQKMLAMSRRAVPPEVKQEDKGKSKGKDDEKDRQRRTGLGGLMLNESPDSFLRRLSNGGGPGRASELGARTTRGMSSVGTAEDEDARRRGQRLARFQEREESLPMPDSVPPLASSPLARRGSNSTVGEIVPHASTSRAAQGAAIAPPLRRVDKGKARADALVLGQSRRHTTNELEADLNPTLREQSTVVRRSRHAPRPSLPAIPSFSLGDDPYTALSHMFHPPPSGAGPTRVYTLPSRPSLPAHPSSADPPMYASLPAHERAMVKAAGMQCMLAAMARNHGFGMEVVGEVCAEAGSLEKTDRVLRDMRESANRQANVSLREMYSCSDDGVGGEEDGDEGEDEEGGSGEDVAEDDEEDDQDQGPEEPEDTEGSERSEEAEEDEPAEDAEDAEDADEDLPDSSAEVDDGDSAEVESVLGQDANSWLDDAPQAESSRIRGGAVEYTEDGMDVDVSRVMSTSTRKPFRIKLLPKELEPAAVYSPPKKTRASRFIKKAQKAKLELAQSPQQGQDAMEVDADPFANAEIPTVKPRYARLPVASLGQLSKYGGEDWLKVERKYGPGAAKMMMGKALEKLLDAHPQ